MSSKNLAMIVAASDNDVIGVDGDLPWHISADLKRFRKLTTGHHIIMGRKTFESIGRLLPDRTTIIITRQSDYFFQGAKITNSVETALLAVNDDDQPFIVGGGEIYKLALPLVRTIHLTRVHTQIKATRCCRKLIGRNGIWLTPSTTKLINATISITRSKSISESMPNESLFTCRRSAARCVVCWMQGFSMPSLRD